MLSITVAPLWTSIVTDHCVPVPHVVDDFVLERVQLGAGREEEARVQAHLRHHGQQQQQLVVAVHSWTKAHAVRQVLRTTKTTNRKWTTEWRGCAVAGKLFLAFYSVSPSRCCCSCVQGTLLVPPCWRDFHFWYECPHYAKKQQHQINNLIRKQGHAWVISRARL